MNEDDLQAIYSIYEEGPSGKGAGITLADVVRELKKAKEAAELLPDLVEIASNTECPACGATVEEHLPNGCYHRDADFTCYGVSPGGTEDCTERIKIVRKAQAAIQAAKETSDGNGTK